MRRQHRQQKGMSHSISCTDEEWEMVLRAQRGTA